MRALTVTPGTNDSAQLRDLPDPVPGPGELLVRAVAVGICGTDRDIVAGEYGTPPPGRDTLTIGHESLGRVVSAGEGFAEGDLVAGVVRRPDPEPCGACARGEFDMCRNGRFTERGIKELDGYASELWTVDSRYVVKVDPSLGDNGVLVEPVSVVVKAWEQIERVGQRSWFEPKRVLVTGAGPIGLMAALLGVQRGLDVHVADHNDDGPKPAAAAALGTTYHSDPVADVAERLRADIVIEATGVPGVVFDAMTRSAAYGIVCLTGVSSAGRRVGVDAGALNRELVLENDVVIGSVNANLRHYNAAVDALVAADQEWLASLITRIPLERYGEALDGDADDIKAVLTFE